MATRTIHLRRGAATDVALVETIMADAFDPRFGEAWTRGQVLGIMAMPGVQLTVATMDDAPVGFALVRAIADEAELLLLAVAPGHRRRGAGGALLRAVMNECQTAGIASLHLEVRANNGAVALYTHHGFTKVGERRGYYRGQSGAVFDAHSYRRDLH